MERILVTGVTGMLGHQLYKCAKNRGNEIFGTIRGKKADRDEANWIYSDPKVFGEVDVFKMNTLIEVLDKVEPKVVINCIGAIKQAEFKKSEIIYLNSYLPQFLGEECSKRHIRLVHISTDCVFSGVKGNYTERDTPDPIDTYGLTKWMGEVTNNQHLTIRTSFIGRELSTHYGLMEWFMSRKGVIRGFRRAYFSGLTTLTLSKAILTLAEKPDIAGLVHVHGERISKYQVLELLVDVFERNDVTIQGDDGVQIDRSLRTERTAELSLKIPPMKDMLVAYNEHLTQESNW